MKILLLVDDYLPSTKAAPVMMRQLGHTLAQKGHDVTLLTPSSELSVPYERSQEDIFPVIRFHSGKIKNVNFIVRVINELLLSWRLIHLFFRLKQKLQADLIITYVPTIFFGLGVLFLKQRLHCQAFMILRDIFPQWIIDNHILHPYSPLTLFFRIFEKLLFPEIEISSWWTNLCEDEAVCIELYYEHATSEQFHSELKSDMGLESLPSGKFATNALVLNLATLAYNCLRFIGQEALSCRNLLPVEIKVSRSRLRSVLQDMIYVGCKLVRHANTLILKFGRNCPWFQCIGAVYARC